MTSFNWRSNMHSSGSYASMERTGCRGLQRSSHFKIYITCVEKCSLNPAQGPVALHADGADLYTRACRGYSLIQSWMHHRAIVWNAQNASQIGKVCSYWKLCRPRQVIRQVEHLH